MVTDSLLRDKKRKVVKELLDTESWYCQRLYTLTKVIPPYLGKFISNTSQAAVVAAAAVIEVLAVLLLVYWPDKILDTCKNVY